MTTALLRRLIPGSLRRMRFLAGWLARGGRDPLQYARIWRSAGRDATMPRVSYGFPKIPAPGAMASGGLVKAQRLQEIFPHTPERFNLLYLVTSALPPDEAILVWLARRTGARIVLNQNGVAYPAWYGAGWQGANVPNRTVLQAADYVFYQSAFCKRSADRFIMPPRAAWEVLHNAVDTQIFTPASAAYRRVATLIIAGTHQSRYRVETALRTLALVRRRLPSMRLIVAGRLAWMPDSRACAAEMLRLAASLGIGDAVALTGPYPQRAAPDTLRRGDMLLHTTYNDACPGLVVEALACGLPVVYSASGGTPELVGDEAGIGVPAPDDYEHMHPPDPTALADAVLRICDRRVEYAAAARQRAVDHFDIRPWIERHRRVFEDLLAHQ